MAVEIRELVIRGTIGRKEVTETAPAAEAPARDDIVAECVEQILKILKHERER